MCEEQVVWEILENLWERYELDRSLLNWLRRVFKMNPLDGAPIKFWLANNFCQGLLRTGPVPGRYIISARDRASSEKSLTEVISQSELGVDQPIRIRMKTRLRMKIFAHSHHFVSIHSKLWWDIHIIVRSGSSWALQILLKNHKNLLKNNSLWRLTWIFWNVLTKRLLLPEISLKSTLNLLLCMRVIWTWALYGFWRLNGNEVYFSWYDISIILGWRNSCIKSGIDRNIWKYHSQMPSRNTVYYESLPKKCPKWLCQK